MKKQKNILKMPDFLFNLHEYLGKEKKSVFRKFRAASHSEKIFGSWDGERVYIVLKYCLQRKEVSSQEN